MNVEDFDYDLPETSIAQTPLEQRDDARLLVALDVDEIVDRRVRDLAEFVRPGDVVVMNSTRVLPARIHLQRPSGGAAEILLLNPLGEPTTGDGGGMEQRWEVLAKPGRKLADGMTLVVPTAVASSELVVTMGAALGEGRREATLRLPSAANPASVEIAAAFQTGLLRALDEVGEMPLPPYLHTVLADKERYQTVVADRPASAAAPTAGLHFTPELIDAIKTNGAQVVTVELVVGLATFRPMMTERVDDHPMHHETYAIDPAVWETIVNARRVIAIGTTSTRALEAAAKTGDLSGSTDLFIKRPFEWRVVDVLMTNFHLPKSSLLVLVDAFVGERWRDLYDHARGAGYRFLSFGDAMLLGRRTQPLPPISPNVGLES